MRALTGVDTDRLEEEKRRGISIDIGFAHFDASADLRVAFIDVPGHEKFIKNMLAGVGGIDFVLLIIAADESIKPQTREHFDICRLLRISSGCVVLTKADLVDADTLAVVKLEIADFVRGSFLEGAPIHAVSSVTGEGLDPLRDTLQVLARDTPSRDASDYLRLPIDRSFVIQGFGTVVTGTVFAGSVALEEELQAYPTDLRLRVRGIQTHGRSAKRATAGQRTALNITGPDHTQLARGMTLARPDLFHPTKLIDCIYEPLPSTKARRGRTPIQFHSATAQVPGEMRMLGDNLARIALSEPLLLLPGDRFIVRLASPSITIGGGEVLDNDPPRRMSQSRASALLKHDRAALLVAERAGGMPKSQLIARTGRRAETLPASIEAFGDWLLDKSVIEDMRERWKEDLKQHHRQQPLSHGISKEELRSRHLPDAPPSVFDTLLSRDKLIAVSDGKVRLASHRLALQQDEQIACDRIVQAFEQAGLKAPGVNEVLQSTGVDQARAKSLLHLLLRQGRLVKVNEELLLHPAAAESLKQILTDRKGARFTVSEFKDWTGVSRKYAIPLLEHLDRERLTRRDGEVRIVL